MVKILMMSAKMATAALVNSIQHPPPTSFSSVTSTNVGFDPQNF